MKLVCGKKKKKKLSQLLNCYSQCTDKWERNFEVSPLESIQGQILFILSDQRPIIFGCTKQRATELKEEAWNVILDSLNWYGDIIGQLYSTNGLVQEEPKDLAHRCSIGMSRVSSNVEGKEHGGTFPSEKEAKHAMVNLKPKTWANSTTLEVSLERNAGDYFNLVSGCNALASMQCPA